MEIVTSSVVELILFAAGAAAAAASFAVRLSLFKQI